MDQPYISAMETFTLLGHPATHPRVRLDYDEDHRKAPFGLVACIREKNIVQGKKHVKHAKLKITVANTDERKFDNNRPIEEIRSLV